TIGGNESNSVRRQSGYINSASSIRRPQFARGGIVGRMLPALLGQDLRENSRRTTPVATQLLRAVAGQPMLYDQGGWLPPGITTVLNATGRPEAVLTEAQLRAIAAGARGGDGSSVTYNVYPRTLDMTVRDLEALQRRQSPMARVARARYMPVLADHPVVPAAPLPGVGYATATYIAHHATVWPLTETSIGWLPRPVGASGLAAAPYALTKDACPRGGARL